VEERERKREKEIESGREKVEEREREGEIKTKNNFNIFIKVNKFGKDYLRRPENGPERCLFLNHSPAP
jgi:hypothetical protein